MLRISALAAALTMSAGAAMAQTAPTVPAPGGMNQPGMAQPSRAGTATGSSNEAVNPANRTGPDATRTGSVTSPTLESGSNSFTEGQARSRMEDAGFQSITGLAKDEQGIWRGQAMRDGRKTEVGLDYKGNVAAR